jgi:hypothetical protein
MSVTTAEPAPRYWMGTVPKACDLCSKPIATSFIDGQVKGATGWANQCLQCHRTRGVAVRPGAGQLYQIQDDGRWLKTQG